MLVNGPLAICEWLSSIDGVVTVENGGVRGRVGGGRGAEGGGRREEDQTASKFLERKPTREQTCLFLVCSAYGSYRFDTGAMLASVLSYGTSIAPRDRRSPQKWAQRIQTKSNASAASGFGTCDNTRTCEDW